MSTDIMQIKKSVLKDLENPNTVLELMRITFKGFQEAAIVQQAVLEARIKGFSLEDFLKKNIYAIPVWNAAEKKMGYMLVEAIKNVRKTAMKSGQTGKSKPAYEYNDDGTIRSCTVTIYKKDGHQDGYTSTAFFSEFEKPPSKDKYGKEIPGMWQKMPHNMIAKVAEMHALRTAFPEELGESYIEEEFDRDTIHVPADSADVQPPKEENQVEFESTMNMLKSAKTVLPLKVYLTKKLPISKYDENQKQEIQKLIEERIKELEPNANPA